MRRVILRGVMAVTIFLVATSASRAFGASTILNHDEADTTSTSAVCLAAPASERGAVVIRRIRITTSRTTAMSHVFVQSRTSDQVNDTSDLSSCVTPTCSIVLAAEGAQADNVVDMTGLAIVLPRGSRFYMYTDVSLNGTGSYQTVEVYYSQISER